MLMVIVSGLPTEETCQEPGKPLSLASGTSVKARTTPVTPTAISESSEMIRMTRATQATLWRRRFLMAALVCFFCVSIAVFLAALSAVLSASVFSMVCPSYGYCKGFYG